MANTFDQFDNPIASGAKDAAVAFAEGANGLLKAVGDIYGLTTGAMDNVVSRQAQENIETLQKQKSPQLIEAERKRKEAVDAETDVVDKAAAYLKNTGPEWRLWLNDIASAAPSTLATGGIGAGARIAAGKLLGTSARTAAKVGLGTAIAAGSGAQAVDTGASQYAELIKTLQEMPEDQALQIPQVAQRVEKGDDLETAKAAVALSLAQDTAVISGLASAATMLVPGGTTVERALVGGAAKKAAPTILRGVAKGAAGEVGQEVTENVSAAGIKNIFARPVEPERKLTEGMGEAIGSSILPAAVMGGMGGVAHGRETLSRPVPEGEATAGMSGQPPVPAATKASLQAEQPATLERSEEMTSDQFWATMNVRQARLLGGEPNAEDVALVGEVPPPRAIINPDVMYKALDDSYEALNAWKKDNPNAPENIVIIFDPEMMHNGYGVQGAFNPNNKAILINAAFVAPERIGQIVNHEWAHQTLSTPEGEQALSKFAEEALKRVNLDELRARYGEDKKPIVLLEEWIAENQEKAPSIIRDIVARVREWLAQFGIVDLNDGEVADIMLRTLREQAEGRIQPDIDRTGGGAEVDPNSEVYDEFATKKVMGEPKYALKKLPTAGDVVDAKGNLKYTIPKKTLDVSHYSRNPDLTEIDPAYYGTGGGQHYHRMMKGINKSFFFVGNSKPAAYENVSGKGMTRYQTTIDSSRIYDMDKDPLELWFAPNPQKSEGALKEIGYDGFYAKTDDGRSFVALFYPTSIEEGTVRREAEVTEPEVVLPEETQEEYFKRLEREDREAMKRMLAEGRKQAKLFSKGSKYSLAQTKTPEFKQWFGDSKVVDKEGKPLVVFHGTLDGGFNVFRTSSGHMYGPGAYFSPDIQTAINYAGARYAVDAAKEGVSAEEIETELPKGRTPAIYPAYLSLQNPIDAYEFESLPGVTNAQRNAEARKRGYDGVIKTWRNGEMVELVAFYPEQIKSATGNVGPFGQRPVTKEEAARVGMTEEEANRARRQGDIRFSLAQEKPISELPSQPENLISSPNDETARSISDFYQNFQHPDAPEAGRAGEAGARGEAADTGQERPEIQSRGAALDSKELTGDGRGFTGFFAAVSAGTKGAQNTGKEYVPVIPISDEAKSFADIRRKYRGNFDNHIATSIPGFEEVQTLVGKAISDTYADGGSMLDIGASEGALIKAVTESSDGNIKTVGIDPNVQMSKHFEKQPVEGSEYLVEAFGSKEQEGQSAWDEDDGTKIRYYNPKGQTFDVIHEAMVFQFISNSRNAQIERMKELLKPDGIVIMEEKVANRGDVYRLNEAKKDRYKAQYYTAEEMEKKRREVLEKGGDKVEGMTNLQVAAWELEQALAKNFKNVAQFWDSGNFKGYVASDDATALNKFLSNLESTETEYSTVETPRTVSGETETGDRGEGDRDQRAGGEPITVEQADKGIRDGTLKFSLAQLESPEFEGFFGNWKTNPEDASKVVDSRGKPRLMFHGTASRDFTIFDTSTQSAGAHFAEEPAVASSFASERPGARVIPVYLNIRNPWRARDLMNWDVSQVLTEWSNQTGEDYDAVQEDFDRTIKEQNVVGKGSTLQIQAFLKSKGYDGIVYLNRYEVYAPGEIAIPGDRYARMSQKRSSSDEEFKQAVPEATDAWIAFDPDQIKSATGNVGSFGQRRVTKEEMTRLGVSPETAAMGQVSGDYRFSLTKTETPEFKRWFGDSQAVDKSGKPLRLLRGGEAGEAEETSMIDRYYTTDPKLASYHAGMDWGGDVREEGKAITPVYLKVENPYYIDDPYDIVNHAFENKRERLIAQGYDGVATRDKTTWYPFDVNAVSSYEVDRSPTNPQNTRVKSVYNVGTFDPENPDISYSLTAQPTELGTSAVDRKLLGISETGKKVPIEVVAKALNDFTKERLGGAEFTDEDVAIAHGVMNAVAEGRNQLLQREGSGADWYDTDIVKTKRMLQLAFPTLKNNTDLVLFTAMMTPLSFGNNPVQNVRAAGRVYEAALAKGDDVWGNLPARQESGKGWSNRAKAVELAINRLNDLINDRGERGAANWLLTKHPVSELRKYNKNVSGKMDDMKYGAYIFGPKGGPFFLNINGIKEEMTKDLWWSRTFNRWFGTMQKTAMEEMTPEERKTAIEEGTIDETTGEPDADFEIQETPRNLAERARMDKIAKGAADELGLTIEELQATLWYYEQQLWKRLGARVESYSFSDGAKTILEDKGIEVPRFRRSSSEAEKRRQVAYDTAGAVLRGEASPVKRKSSVLATP